MGKDVKVTQNNRKGDIMFLSNFSPEVVDFLLVLSKAFNNSRSHLQGLPH